MTVRSTDDWIDDSISKELLFIMEKEAQYMISAHIIMTAYITINTLNKVSEHHLKGP